MTPQPPRDWYIRDDGMTIAHSNVPFDGAEQFVHISALKERDDEIEMLKEEREHFLRVEQDYREQIERLTKTKDTIWEQRDQAYGELDKLSALLLECERALEFYNAQDPLGVRARPCELLTKLKDFKEGK